MTCRLLAVGALFLVSTAPAAAQWTQGGLGRVWVKSAFYLQQTDQEFDLTGTKRTEPTGKAANSKAVFTDVIVGILPELDLWLQIPFLDLQITGSGPDLRSTGFGDVRAWLRYQVARLHKGQTPIALRMGVKAPVGFQSLDAQIVPIGEGQWDLEFFGEIGHSFWPTPLYAELWLGYRARFANNTTFKDPGGEFVYLAEVGGNPTGGTLLKATLDGFVGRNWTVERLPTASSRRIVSLQLAGGVNVVGPLWTEAGVRVPLDGRSFAAGPQFVAGLSAALRFR